MIHLLCASTSRLVPAASVEGFSCDRRRCGAIIHLLCASTSRLVLAASMEGFFCDRYAVRSRGSCLCSERSLIKWVILAISLLLVLKMLYISKAETTTVPYI